jgi:hypothetical protein
MARLQQKSRRQSPQVQPDIRHSLRDSFHASFVLSPVSGLLATVISGIIITRQLGASIGAPGPHDFASAKLPFVRASKTRCGILAAIASPPRVS